MPAVRFYTGVNERFRALEAQPGGRVREGIGVENCLNRWHAAG